MSRDQQSSKQENARTNALSSDKYRELRGEASEKREHELEAMGFSPVGPELVEESFPDELVDPDATDPSSVVPRTTEEGVENRAGRDRRMRRRAG